ncbi:hypothetical protein [Leisingera sp. ANG-M6]|uniref:hypothetical protein n=1 Tax=Leisingera sp. ANG-M6 TaxID=1577900 RepID=UPI00057F6074|nr:hypothetical protein [Leisingera sp. ANG-M6]KIC28634.1 hypothetical protein RA24_12070 [Leisingera sp. ANG-M6]
MKFPHLTACALVFGIAAAAPASAGAIKKQKDFVAAIAGKKLVSGNSWIVVSADGKLTGVSSKGEKITGAWVWNKRFVCRNVYVGSKQLPQDCQTVTTDGNTVTFTRDKGKGRAITYSF